MAEKMSEVYEAYEMEVLQTVRGRGATILRTTEGVKQLKIPEVNESRLIAEYEFKEQLFNEGFENIDRCIKNKEGDLVTFDKYGNPYVMRNYFEGRECDVTKLDEILFAVENLATMHKACERVFKNTEGDVHVRLSSDFRRRNQEMKRVYSYMQKKKRKNDFEELYKSAFNKFYTQALECENKFGELNIINSQKYLGYCHGAYDYHSLIYYSVDDVPNIATVNFDKFYVGNQLADLYHFMRKTLEKNNYSFEIALAILGKYSELNKLSADDIEYIYVLYSYPEKFYKISNRYMNSSKVRISPKMNEKLYKVIDDEDSKQKLLKNLNYYKNQLKSI